MIMRPDLMHSMLTFACLCLMLRTFADSLGSDQARQNVEPDLDPNCLTL